MNIISNNYNKLKEYILYLYSHFTIIELSGSLGDLGTLLPIIISLSKTGQISLASTLVFGGLWNLASGLTFGIPMCVQPMKAIAAVALAKNMSIQEIMSAGIFVSSVVTFLGLSQTLSLITRYIPLPIIRGIQLGAGIQLSLKAINMVEVLKWGGKGWLWYDNYELVIFGLILVFVLFFQTKFPTAVLIFLIGLLFTIIHMVLSNIQGPYPSLFKPPIIVPSPTEFGNGLLQAGLGQLPLTLLNSVIALAFLADDLFPSKAPHSITKIAVSVGMMNLIGCFFGSMPYCHGSGGLAGQYRFGSRSELSVIILGLVKLLLGLLFGDSLLSTLNAFPNSILAVMLFISGIELSRAARNFSKSSDTEFVSRDFTIMIVTTTSLVGFKNDGIGFLTGCLVAICFKVYEYFEKRYQNRVILDTPSNANNTKDDNDDDPFV